MSQLAIVTVIAAPFNVSEFNWRDTTTLIGPPIKLMNADDFDAKFWQKNVACRVPTISPSYPSNNPTSSTPFIRRCFALLPSVHNNYGSRVHRARRVIPPPPRAAPLSSSGT